MQLDFCSAELEAKLNIELILFSILLVEQCIMNGMSSSLQCFVLNYVQAHN